MKKIVVGIFIALCLNACSSTYVYRVTYKDPISGETVSVKSYSVYTNDGSVTYIDPVTHQNVTVIGPSKVEYSAIGFE